MDQGTKVIMRGDHALEIQGFISTGPGRYYLAGFNVERDPVKGLRIVATDGHRLGCLHDVDGTMTGPNIIVKLPKAALAMLKGKVPVKSSSYQWYVVIENGAVSLHYGTKHDNLSPACGTFGDVLIDGAFPDWTRVVPSPAMVEQDRHTSFNAKYMAPFAAIGAAGQVTLLPGDDADAPMVVLAAGRADFLGVLMPMRAGDTSLPSFWTSAPHAWTAPDDTAELNTPSAIAAE